MRIYIADQHPLLRERISAFLGGLGAVSEVLAFANGRALKRAMCDREPDLVLLDLNLGDLRGAEFIRFVKAEYPQVALIAMLGMEDTFIRQHCLEVGAASVVVKSEIFNSLSMLVGAVADGQPVKK
ncbi:response regulator [Litorivivens sp.]|uniref:response regulator n=1 Tax=Litorivivens sp. TaxID=2020868 RepID=UPI003568CBC2